LILKYSPNAGKGEFRRPARGQSIKVSVWSFWPRQTF